MGINAELVNIVADLRLAGLLTGTSVIELGSQVVCAREDVVDFLLSSSGFKLAEVRTSTAEQLYRSVGFEKYCCIDASGELDALIFDLNVDIRAQYGFRDQFDLVTNLGTAEHCFDQCAVFRNIHNLCKVGGLMIHAAPSQGNVNHAFYNYQPRFFMDLAKANGYEILSIAFTVDYTPRLIDYTIENFRRWDNHDILLYVVLRKVDNRDFVVPFDGMFSRVNELEGYHDAGVDPLVTEFAPYLKGGRWENTQGAELLANASVGPGVLRRTLRAIFKG